jgi:hypothetical protein
MLRRAWLSRSAEAAREQSDTQEATVLRVKQKWLGRRMPSCIIPDHGIEHRQEFAHTSSQGDFLALALGQQALIEGFDHGVKPGGGD